MKLLLIALSMLFVLPAPISSVGFIGGADGPTAILVSGSPRLLPALCGFLGILFANAGR